MQLPKTNSFLAVLGFLAAAFPSLSYNSDWALVFNDEFAASSFTDGKLNWDEKWNKTDYLNASVPDWRKYQSRDDALVTQGISGSTDYVSLKGAYGDYTSQSDQTGEADTFACGGIFTYDTFAFQYGYMEVRARFDSAKGAWPAIWLMPVPSTSKGWLASGEIDIMEHINYESRIHQTLHLYNNSRTADAAPSRVSPISNTNDWHTYGVEWNPDSISFFIDGTRTSTFYASNYTYWPFADENSKFYLLLDQQLGGSWTGEPDAASLSSDSADLDIDYVRVYSTPEASAASTPAATWDTLSQAPVAPDGTPITYSAVPEKTSGILDQPDSGNYLYTVNGSLSHILSEGSHIQLRTESGDSTISMDNAMVQAASLYMTEGKYLLSGSATLDVDTLILSGASLEIDSEYALNNVKHMFLGMESDAITSFAARNAAMYLTENQHISADITLVNDSKIAVYQGKTLEIGGNIRADSSTLNIVGVNSNGTATMVLKGAHNKLTRLTMGVAETTEKGNTFLGAGQILELKLATGSNTEITHLQTASPVANSPSTLTIMQGATLSVTDSWSNPSPGTFQVKIEQDGILHIGKEGAQASVTTLTGVSDLNKGVIHFHNDGTLIAHSGRVEFAEGLSGSGRVQVQDKATVSMSGNAASNTITLAQQASLETVGNFSGGLISGSGTIKKLDSGHASITTDSSFSGSIEAGGGSITITGSALFNTISATGGKLTVLSVSDGITVHTLQILEGGHVGVFNSTNESTIRVTHAMSAGDGLLQANLLLDDGVTLDVTGSGSLAMGSSITLSGKITLGDNIVSALAADDFESYTLATSMDGFITAADGKIWEHGDTATASSLFLADELDLDAFSVIYHREIPHDAGTGMLRITKIIPEPSTCILSLLSITLLLHKRRRK